MTVLALCLLAAPAAAQGRGAPGLATAVPVNGEEEQYLRLLQLTGQVPLHPWSVRGFSPGELDRIAPSDTAHPWAGRYAFAQRSGSVRATGLAAGVVYNSALPVGGDDGPLWAGRGGTAYLQGGVSARLGGLSLTLAPIAFVAQNRAFDLLPNGGGEEMRYADPRRAPGIDLPQRFGDAPYGRVDPGQSTLRLDLGFLGVGASTASQHWGPGVETPLILGSNAGGFPHLFAGTSRPVDVGIGSVHGRLTWGELAQSPYATTHPDSTRRFMSGLAAVFTPAPLPGLELGISRFFHTPWPSEGLHTGNFLKPLEGFVKVNLPKTGLGPDAKSDVDNQLASVFFRWVLPESGFEVYGEYAREDHSYDLRDLFLQPDHSGGYAVGARKLWHSASRIVALRAEVLNAEISHIALARPQAFFYQHSMTRQGHTHRGQILGAPAAYGGAGASVVLDRYTRDGRVSLGWSRALLQEFAGDSMPLRQAHRVRHAVEAEALRFHGPVELRLSASPSLELNRSPGRDVFNFNGRFTVALRLP